MLTVNLAGSRITWGALGRPVGLILIALIEMGGPAHWVTPFPGWDPGDRELSCSLLLTSLCFLTGCHVTSCLNFPATKHCPPDLWIRINLSFLELLLSACCPTSRKGTETDVVTHCPEAGLALWALLQL